MLKTTLLTTLLVAANLLSTERFELERGDGSHLVGYVDAPKSKSFALVLFIQGAQEESVQRLHESLKSSFQEIGLGLATLEKRGISRPEEIDRKEYYRSHSLKERRDDCLLFLNRKKVEGWNGKIILIGQGEGGRIGAELAAARDPVIGLVLIAAGGGWPPAEELLASFRTEMAQSGFSPKYIQSFLVQAREQLANALKKPEHDREAFGFSYKYWESVMKTDLTASLSQTHCPIYYLHGDKDDRIPLESVHALQEKLKEHPQFTVKHYDAGREITQDPNTYKDIISWIDQLD